MPLAAIRVSVSASHQFTSYKISLSVFGVPKGTFPQNPDVMSYSELQCTGVLFVGCVCVVDVDDDVVAVSTVCSGIVFCVGLLVCKSSAFMILLRCSSV